MELAIVFFLALLTGRFSGGNGRLQPPPPVPPAPVRLPDVRLSPVERQPTSTPVAPPRAPAPSPRVPSPRIPLPRVPVPRVPTRPAPVNPPVVLEPEAPEPIDDAPPVATRATVEVQRGEGLSQIAQRLGRPGAIDDVRALRNANIPQGPGGIRWQSTSTGNLAQEGRSGGLQPGDVLFVPPEWG